MKRVFNILSVMLMTSLMIWSSFHYDDNVKQETVTSTVANYIPTYTSTQNVLDVKIIEEEVEEVEQMSEEDINLIALVTMAEAEGESELGKRLVIDTILNRIDSEHFPDTASEVIYQPNQFTSMWNDRVDKCYVSDDICQLVREELELRENYDVIFFTAGRYSKYGSQMFQVGNHYFSSYE